MAYLGLNAVGVANATYDFLVVQSPHDDYLCRDEPLELCLDRSAFTEYDLWELLLHSGDRQYAQHHGPRLWRHVEQKVRPSRDHRGLYRTPLMLPVGPGYDASLPGQTTVYRGLRAASALANELDQPERAGLYAQWAAELAELINTLFWDEQAGAYRYTLGSSHFDQMGNAMAVLHGIAPADRCSRVLSLLKQRHWRTWDGRTWGDERPWGPTDFDRPWAPGEDGYDEPPCERRWDADYHYSPSGSNYNYCIAPQMVATEAAAHFLRGCEHDALTVIRRCFGNMLRQGSDTLWEQASPLGQHRYLSGHYSGSLCHRWAAMAGSVLTQFVLGVKAVEPGYRKTTIAPRCCDLTWAEGSVPAPTGPIRVSWRREAGQFELKIALPPLVVASVAPPFRQELTVDDRPAAKAAIELREGEHTLRARCPSE